MKLKSPDADALWAAHRQLRVTQAKDAVRAAKSALAKAEAELEKAKAL